jgi:ABC-2 type transport system ATP-binding protein
MLRFERLRKAFHSRPVIHDCSGRFGPGIFALQGPNGIGKSTLLAALAGALPLDAGEVWIDGVSLGDDPVAVRRRLSYSPDESPIYPFLRGRDFLEFVAKAKDVPLDAVVEQLISGFGLEPHMGTRFGDMSLGTQKKFLLVAAWIGDPRVLLLDEPANGLDTAAREFLADLMRRDMARTTVLFSSHDHDFIADAGANPVQVEALFSGRFNASA